MRINQTQMKWAFVLFFMFMTLVNMRFALTPQVVTFNKKTVVARFVGQLSQHTLSDAGLARKTTQFSDALNSALLSYATSHHVLIMNQADMLAGSFDITPEIMKVVAKNMRKKS